MTATHVIAAPVIVPGGPPQVRQRKFFFFFLNLFMTLSLVTIVLEHNH